MKPYKSFFIVALAALILSACAAQPPAVNPPEPTQPAASSVPTTASSGDALAGSAWKLVSFGPAGAEKPALPGHPVTLTFDQQGQAGGNGGCNSYGGSYTVNQSKLKIGQMMRTLMACTGDGVMEQEDGYLAALEKADSFTLTGDQLVITSADGQTRLTFTRGG